MNVIGPVIEGLQQLIEENKKPGMVVAELGVYDGSTTWRLAQLVKEVGGKYIAVDWFKGNDGIIDGAHSFSEDKHESILGAFKANIKEANVEDTVEVFDMTTLEAAKLIPDQSLDICFIDADHRYTGVKEDILAYLPKVKPGGIICGHDFEPHVADRFNTFTPEHLEVDWVDGCHPGVIQAVGEEFGIENVLTYPNNVWAIKLK